MAAYSPGRRNVFPHRFVKVVQLCNQFRRRSGCGFLGEQASEEDQLFEVRQTLPPYLYQFDAIQTQNINGRLALRGIANGRRVFIVKRDVDGRVELLSQMKSQIHQPETVRHLVDLRQQLIRRLRFHHLPQI
ncbi:MAG TPA: hypothetical protein VHR66_09600 [Gemmataceae bacterium]|jgi:hypothetical protein|nr:hypothetical protein [Gemmataceae bacterium]